MKIYLLVIALSFFGFSLAQQQVGDSLMAIGRYDGAIQAYKNGPKTADRHFKIARAATAMGNTLVAIDFYKTGFKTDSLSIQPRWEYGKLVLGQDDFTTAIQVFSELIVAQPDNAAYHYYLGKTLSEISMDVEAILSFEKALNLNIDYRSARIELVKSYLKKRESVKAMILCDVYLEDHPDDIKVNSLYAQSLMNAKNYKKAVTVFEHLFELGNDTEYNRKSLGFAFYSIAEYEKSLEQYEKYQQDYDEKEPAINFMMSKCYLSLRKLDQAMDFIERAIVFKTPILDQEYLQLASIYANKKDLKSTLYALKRASKENPASDDIAYQVVIGADRYFKDKKEKLTYYEDFMERYPNSDYYEIASARASDLKKELFMTGDD
jgi:tetratricopeptide (TPR) repeat protein